MQVMIMGNPQGESIIVTIIIIFVVKLAIGVVDIIANSVDTTLIRVNMIQHCW